MKDVNELLSDREHAVKIIRKLADTRFADAGEKDSSYAKYILRNIEEYCDKNSDDLKNISYLDVISCLKEIKDSDDCNISYPIGGGSYSKKDVYLLDSGLLGQMLIRGEKYCPWVKILLAIPLRVVFEALGEINGCRDEIMKHYYRLHVSYIQPYEMCPMSPGKDGCETMKDILTLQLAVTSKYWQPTVRSVFTYQKEITGTLGDIGELLVDSFAEAFIKSNDEEDNDKAFEEIEVHFYEDDNFDPFDLFDDEDSVH